ncbi:anthranilate synthase component I family protein [Nocardioides seonyuensis]|uniref:Anthranilate synthase component I family protein n=1 Tax=Nocardioides seonyuensis TaxID=2518371 RepID=A0A4P7IHI2_9ACTN|nr:anthranilate synthase component I family protein [Nocardioides seonyuensis]QBX55627.1 anthranilate synthase component I family protein [Nocardioides seonyuensis]
MTDPVAFFREVASRHPRCFWLDGGGAREWSGRRSIIGWLHDDAPSLSYDAAAGVVTRHSGGASVVVGTDPFVVLEETMQPGEQWFGCFGYASRPDLPARPASSGPGDAMPGDAMPDAVWMRASHVRMFDHAESAQTSRRVGANPPPSRREPPVESAPGWYAAAYDRVQEHLHAGNSYEVNLTYREEIESDLAPSEAYLRLRDLNPAPYAGFLQHDVDGARAWLLSSSPERFALVGEDRTIETRPIKGTTDRGSTPEDDRRQRERLASDAKFRAENLMIVDLLRHDLATVSEPGSVEVPQLMAVETYASVHQLVSTVRGQLRNDVSTVAALRAIFPAGSMTGAPKLRTMQVIEEVELTPRGLYSGAFGWISGDGAADLGVVIRSLTTGGDGRWTFGTGGGITVRSDAAEEWAETRWKAARLRAAVDL